MPMHASFGKPIIRRWIHDHQFQGANRDHADKLVFKFACVIGILIVFGLGVA